MKDSSRELLACAYIIGEYSTALDHLDALRRVQVHVAPAVFSRLERERGEYARLWWAATHGDPTWVDGHTDAVVAEAREWCTRHVVDLDDLIANKEEKKEPDDNDEYGQVVRTAT